MNWTLLLFALVVFLIVVRVMKERARNGNDKKNGKTKEATDKVKGFLSERPVTLTYVVINVVFASLSMLVYIPKIFPNFAGRFMADGTAAIATIIGILFLAGGLQFSKSFRDSASVIMFIVWLTLLIVSTMSNVPPPK